MKPVKLTSKQSNSMKMGTKRDRTTVKLIREIKFTGAAQEGVQNWEIFKPKILKR